MTTFRAEAGILLAGCLLLSAPGLAQERDFNASQGTGGAFGPPHISGIRATLIDITGLEVTVNVTELYVTNAAWTFNTAWIGVASTFGGFPLIPAISWGDGSTVPWAGYGPSAGIPISAYNTTLNGSPVHLYVGSFSHTYATRDKYTVTVNSINGVGTTAGQAPPLITGSLVSSVTPTLGNTYYFVRNTTVAPLVISVASDSTEIATVSDLGLLILALVLAASALVTLRR